MDRFDIQKSLQNGVDRTFAYLPQVLGALLLLIVGHFVARILEGAVRRLLQTVRFDKAINASPVGSTLARMIESPAKLAGQVTYWVIFFLFITSAVSALNIPALNDIVVGVYAYIPKVVAAVLIFLVASAITAGADRLTQRVLGSGPTARLIAAILPAVTMSIAIFMILNQLNIAKDIVNITYMAIMGSLSLGLALAFGLGGRDVASQILGQAYQATQRTVAAETKARSRRR